MLPNTSITTTIVGNEIGLGTRNLRKLIVTPKTGGEFDSAFNSADGILLYESLPFWNIYSNGIPAMWYVSDTDKLAGVYPKFILKLGDPTGLRPYSYRLGGFRNYQHDALPPTIENKVYNVPGSGFDGIDATVLCTFGTFNWKGIPTITPATRVCVLYQKTYTGDFMKMPSVSFISIPPTGIQMPVKTIGQVENGTHDLYLALLNDNDDVVGVLPVKGSITLKVSVSSKVEILTNIGTYLTVNDTYTSLNYDTFKLSGSITVKSTLDKTYKLRRLILSFVNSDGNNLEKSVLVPEGTEQPSQFDYYEDGVGTTKAVDVALIYYSSYLKQSNGNYTITLSYI